MNQCVPGHTDMLVHACKALRSRSCGQMQHHCYGYTAGLQHRRISNTPGHWDSSCRHKVSGVSLSAWRQLHYCMSQKEKLQSSLEWGQARWFYTVPITPGLLGQGTCYMLETAVIKDDGTTPHTASHYTVSQPGRDLIQPQIPA